MGKKSTVAINNGYGESYDDAYLCITDVDYKKDSQTVSFLIKIYKDQTTRNNDKENISNNSPFQLYRIEKNGSFVTTNFPISDSHPIDQAYAILTDLAGFETWTIDVI